MNDADRQRLASLLFPSRPASSGGARTYTAAADSSGGTVSVVIGSPEYDEFGNEVVSLADVTVSVPIIGRASNGDDVLVQIVDGNPIALGAAGWGDSIADYVTASGTSGIWEWRIWASGKAECWGKSSSQTVSSWTVWANSIYNSTSTLAGAAFPTDFFNSAPEHATVEFIATANDAWLGYTDPATATNAPKVYLLRPNSTSCTGYFQYYARGTVSDDFPYNPGQGGGGDLPDGDDLGYGD